MQRYEKVERIDFCINNACNYFYLLAQLYYYIRLNLPAVIFECILIKVVLVLTLFLLRLQSKNLASEHVHSGHIIIAREKQIGTS